MALDTLFVANQFLQRANRDKQSLNLDTLQKLIILAHANVLIMYGEPLITCEVFMQGKTPQLIRIAQEFASDYATETITRYARMNGEYLPEYTAADNKHTKIIDAVWEQFLKDGAHTLTIIDDTFLFCDPNTRVSNQTLTHLFTRGSSPRYKETQSVL